jgi:5-oxoprolinase (ATP-hydrolysing)
LTFGAGGKDKDGGNSAGWGYYEVGVLAEKYQARYSILGYQTIAGGSGAGPDWHGTSGVHTHITNTRIGDVEILERRYPVLLHQFALRTDSAGAGKWRGGEGAVREFEVLQGLQVSILSEVSIVVLLEWTA